MKTSKDVKGDLSKKMNLENKSVKKFAFFKLLIEMLDKILIAKC